MAEAMFSIICEKLHLNYLEDVSFLEEIQRQRRREDARRLGNSLKARGQMRSLQILLYLVIKDADSLRVLLNRIEGSLADAERRQMDEETVKACLDEVKDVVYDYEDLLDEWKTRKQMIKQDFEDARVSEKNKTVICFSFYSPSFDFDEAQIIRLGRAITSKGNSVLQRLMEISEQIGRFKFSFLSFENPVKPLSSTSLLDTSVIYDRDDEKNSIISKLLSESSEEGKSLRIISIVGMEGIGKTALARLVYNDERVSSYFDKKMWVRVSHDFDVLRIAKLMMESLQVMDFSSNNLNSYLVHISQCIVGKKFFLVLDDVATENYSSWEMLHNCLKNGLHGSKILIIARKESIARMIHSIDIYTLKELSEDECWSLFGQIAFLDRSLEECEELKEIGRQIVGKCKGLPLAIKTIGNVLRFKRNKEEWQLILESKMWQLEKFERRSFYPLWLSYNSLPSIVKLCFSYCAIYPKDHPINKDELIKLWMAQGYLGKEKNIEMEAVGEEYFDLLVTRFLFQEFDRDDDGNIVRCKMDYIVHDFVQYLAQNECGILEVYGDLEEPRINGKLRHLRLKLYEGVSFPDSMLEDKQLRSLLIDYGVANSLSINEVLPKLLNELTSLRALNLSGQLWYENVIILIPKEIGKLIHLKYLNLSSLKIDELPEELCGLQNLQTLELSWCTNLKRLPQGMGKLINLRHLVNDGTSLSFMPKGIERLTCLRMLSEFVVGGSRGEACTLECLKNLNHLRGSLSIKKLGNVTHFSEVKEAELKNKIKLIRLYLNFENDVEEASMNGVEGKIKMTTHELILEALEPPPNLEFLDISGYKGNTFPDWIMSLSKLKTLNFHHCTSINHLPPLGKLPSLESLSLCSMLSVRRVDDEFLGIRSDGASSSSSVVAFPKLKSLKFVDMEEWEDWDCGSTVLPYLHFLSLVHCPKLRALPDQMLQTEELQELNINWCPILKKRYSRHTSKGWHEISRIPNIMINFEYVQGDGH